MTPPGIPGRVVSEIPDVADGDRGDTADRPLSWWRDRETFLAEFEEIERLCLGYL